MKCEKCGGELRQETTVQAPGLNGSTTLAICRTCKRRFTLVRVLVHEALKQGDGAYATARKLSEAATRGIPIINPEALDSSSTGEKPHKET